MDEWESVRLKIKELELHFLRPSDPDGAASSEPMASDFWKRKYVREKSDWEKTLSAKAREQADLQERYVKDEEGISLLTHKIQNLEKKLDSERALWEAQGKVRFLESELSAVKKDWEEKASSLLKQNLALQEKLQSAPEKAAEEERKLNQVQAEKLKAEQAVKALEYQILELKKTGGTAAQIIESEKKSLQEAMVLMERDRAQTRLKISQLEKESVRLLKERDLAFARIEAREQEHLRELEDLMMGFSRRIKNHVGIMTGTFTETVSGAAEDPGREASAELFRKSAREIAELLEEFLEFSRVPAADMRKTDLNLLVGRAIARKREQIQESKAVLEKNFAASLSTVLGDEDRIVLAVEEIIVNALEAMPSGKRLSFAVVPNEEDRLIRVEVRDEGSGIAKEIEGKIFRPYFTTRKGRRGLGLSRVRRCMDLHNGSVRISNAINGGTVVSLEFPFPE